MKASEFRIGNWYQNKSVDIDLRYQQITFFEDAHYAATYCDAIPLTEQWLCSFGMYEYPHKMLDGVIKLRDGVYFFKYNEFQIAIHYVHQLQNLYFALTNEELIYTERYEKGKQRG